MDCDDVVRGRFEHRSVSRYPITAEELRQVDATKHHPLSGLPPDASIEHHGSGSVSTAGDAHIDAGGRRVGYLLRNRPGLHKHYALRSLSGDGTCEAMCGR